ncbi:MAG: hypothetical protein A3I68_04410 [Candidatus Melainabacteria bacterium RIFCSPLOWO2_02_FULL_35_15]|nr:MAG: hypothetical protein A3F80_02020 [Candidatus Melainabacteria bacterium RIFCSPLOWO2_12_FULL_35_11]OGI12758.1 MAG: hypothetical protein A3I68_04410 [Candidatus Melainabacteria bacterium RIFCSPLOWO2_02_FULL_35_15]
MPKSILYFFLSLIFITSSIVLPAKSNDNPEENLIADEQTTLKGSASYSDLIPKYTKLKVSVNKEIDSLQNQIGDEFSATVLNDLNINDINLIPVGSIVIGHVMDIKHAGRASMQGSIDIAFDKIVLPSGKYIPLSGAKFAANKKYTNKNRNLKGEEDGIARGIGLGVLKGATLTFIPGSKAVKTAAIGAAATGAVLSGGWSITSTAVIGGLTGLAYGIKKHGQEVMIASGQELEIELGEIQDLNPLEIAVDDLMNQAIETTNSNEIIIK